MFQLIKPYCRAWYFSLFIVFLSACKADENIDVRDNFQKAYISNGLSNTISVLDLEEEIPKFTIQLDEYGRFPHHIGLSPDKSKLVLANPEFDFTLGHNALHNATDKKGGVLVLDAKTGDKLLSLSLPFVNYNALFSPDGKEIWTATSSHSGDLFVFDAVTGKLKNQIPLGLSPSELVFTADGRWAFIALSESSFVYVVEVATKKITASIKVDLFPSNTWLGNDGKIYVENKSSKSINIINPLTMTVEDYLDLPFTPGKIGMNLKNNELWICNSGEDKVYYCRKENNRWKIIDFVQTGADAHSLCFSKDEKWLYVVNQGGNSVSIIDVASHKKMKDIFVGKQPNGIVLDEN